MNKPIDGLETWQKDVIIRSLSTEVSDLTGQTTYLREDVEYLKKENADLRERIHELNNQPAKDMFLECVEVKKIQAIKQLRAYFGLSLKDAKDCVDFVSEKVWMNKLNTPKVEPEKLPF
jgi:ribosomal protein L7/L12